MLLGEYYVVNATWRTLANDTARLLSGRCYMTNLMGNIVWLMQLGECIAVDDTPRRSLGGQFYSGMIV